MRTTRLVLVVPALLLTLSGCLNQPKAANEDGPQEQPVRPADVFRTPTGVEGGSLTVDPPGPTRSP